ncbi:4'-phosphopantetheinyl transferase superfamily protein [Bradyrhizobium betae]|uniref:4'-phosphopantetheinyl transferase family protein n=1 Tax=Bradyrhizobium betae TaxID=244734 RepID=UPI003D66E0F3
MNISGSSDLDSNSVAVWWIDLDTISEDQTRMLRGLLPSDETARIDRLLRPIDRKRSIVAHAALRLLLSRLIGLPNSQLAITRTTDGKPIWPQSGYEFSLSHSGRRVVLAISQGPQVGIDVEEHRHFSDLADMIPLYFHAGEAAELMALAPARREDGFFTMWCAKEAVVKALGQGLRSPLSGFQISNSGGSYDWPSRPAVSLRRTGRCTRYPLALIIGPPSPLGVMRLIWVTMSLLLPRLALQYLSNPLHITTPQTDVS